MSAAAAEERLEDPLAVGGRDARPAVDDADEQPPAAHPRAHRDGSPAPWRPAFSSRFANARSSCAASARISGRSRSTASRTRSAGSPASSTASRSTSSTDVQSRRGSAAPGLQPRQLDQLVDEPRQPGALARDARRRARVRSSSDSDGDAERLGAGRDRGQRGAQVVRDRAQDRGLDLVRAAQRARLDHLADEPLALERGGEQRLQRRPGRVAPRRAPRPGRAACRAAPRRAAAAPRRCARRPPTSPSTIRHDGEPERLRDPLRGGGERAGQVGRAEQDARELGGEVGLAAALLGLRGAHARRLGDARGDHRRDEEDRERDPVLRLVDREAAGRLDVEEVEGERADDARARPPARRPTRSRRRSTPSR